MRIRPLGLAPSAYSGLCHRGASRAPTAQPPGQTKADDRPNDGFPSDLRTLATAPWSALP